MKVAVQKDEEINTRSLERELMEIIDLYAAIPIKQLNLGRLLLDVTDTMREHRLGIRPDMATMIKALITLEGVARSIYPDLDVIAEAEPYIRQIASKRYSPRAIWRNVTTTLAEIFTMRGGVPRRLAKIVQKLEHGKLHIRFEHENLQGLQDTFDNVANRVTFGIIIGALIIGSSMIITTGVRPYLFGYPAFGIIGYIVSALLGLWLVFNIIRSRNY
jgi:ubiquinone biosynthesis protein